MVAIPLFFLISWNKLLNKQSGFQWFETLAGPYDVRFFAPYICIGQCTLNCLITGLIQADLSIQFWTENMSLPYPEIDIIINFISSLVF